jgi:hypothetical protein
MEAGMKNPGRAGLTADRIGDAEKWAPPTLVSVDESNIMPMEHGKDAASSD